MDTPNAYPNPCRIIGVLDNGVQGLTPQALGHLRRADLVIGGARALALLADALAPNAKTRDLTGQLARVPQWIRKARAAGQRVVVLATGDPLCHGIAGFLQARLCIEACEILPNVSLVQLACARLGIPWQDMKILSVHGPDTGEWPKGAGPEHGLYPLLRALGRHDRLAVYTSPSNGPDRIARLLVAEGFADEFLLAVAERLLGENERVIAHGAAQDVARQRFAEPNVVLLWRVEPRPRATLFGLPDETYYPKARIPPSATGDNASVSDGRIMEAGGGARDRRQRREKRLITKREARAVSLARLELAVDSIVWDIGAGSGAVGLEAARLCPDGHVYAMEKNARGCADIAHNRRRLRVTNHTLAHGKAPSGLGDWPDPDGIFIGGTGGELAGLLSLCLERLRSGGRLVMNFVTFENLSAAMGILKARGTTWDVTQLTVARGRPILDMHRLAAENPVWIVCAQPDNPGLPTVPRAHKNEGI